MLKIRSREEIRSEIEAIIVRFSKEPGPFGPNLSSIIEAMVDIRFNIQKDFIDLIENMKSILEKSK